VYNRTLLIIKKNELLNNKDELQKHCSKKPYSRAHTFGICLCAVLGQAGKCDLWLILCGAELPKRQMIKFKIFEFHYM
jgi:hypothetical protein